MDHKELRGRFSTLDKFFKSYFGYLALVDYCENIDQAYLGMHPYTHISNTLLSDATIQWCKLFGTDSESTHWKKLIINHSGFREYLFETIKQDKNGFREYQLSMLTFRDKWVAHYESNFPHGTVPLFEIAVSSATALQEYLKLNQPEDYDYSGICSIDAFGHSFGMALLDPLKHAIKT
ncbi:hypothetical protein [Aliivibrio finisterrensis]|uniref:Uncharacterized protein n=1 Tax=Aliivibrio finisterrensis TaxID=511998 RepID=A0A6N6RNR3_9GAMM|nr:hypothetical protein [Aliivibrio finisterrensis]KAB2823089.1 hypothetical protein F8B77_17070 [Aliivibrio finisterrensis]